MFSVELLIVSLFALPTASVVVMGSCMLMPRMLKPGGDPNRGELLFARINAVVYSLSAIAAVGLAAMMLQQGRRTAHAEIGSWFTIEHHHFIWRLVADWLTIPFAIAVPVLVGLIGVFSRRYLHREPGYFRFYLLLGVFGAATQLVVLAGSLDLVFFGWELVGLSSALLIAFFFERKGPVTNGIRAFVTYRVCDVGILVALVWMHHLLGTTELTTAGEVWHTLPAPLEAGSATVLGIALLLGASGKSAQVPFGEWLPRAMEGPTPSSAIFYGAISIHLGPFLLLRAVDIISASPATRVAVLVVGGLTALHGTFVGRAQTDIKSALAYASMTQVGVIYVEIGLGLHYVAVIHILGHAFMRSLQILRSPSLLHDHHHLEQAMGTTLPRLGAHLERWVPRRLQPWLYKHALERGMFEVILKDGVVGGFLRWWRWVDSLDQGWVRWLSQSGDDSSKLPSSSSKSATRVEAVAK